MMALYLILGLILAFAAFKIVDSVFFNHRLSLTAIERLRKWAEE